MKITFEMLKVITRQRIEFLDITHEVQDRLLKHDIREGQIILNSLHTTVALFTSSFQKAGLEDLQAWLGYVVPEQGSYRHNDPRYSDCDRHNADAHLRAILLGGSVILPLADQAPILGPGQRIILAEFDGPRERSIVLQVTGV